MLKSLDYVSKVIPFSATSIHAFNCCRVSFSSSLFILVAEKKSYLNNALLFSPFSAKFKAKYFDSAEKTKEEESFVSEIAITI